jgi:hypothetical protein
VWDKGQPLAIIAGNPETFNQFRVEKAERTL